MMAGQHLKIGGLELEDDGTAGEPGVRQAAGDAIAEGTKGLCQLPGMAQNACEGGLRRDALRRSDAMTFRLSSPAANRARLRPKLPNQATNLAFRR